jgi:hypothetical protein
MKEIMSDDIVVVTERDILELVLAAKTVKDMKQMGSIIGVMDRDEYLSVQMVDDVFFASFDIWTHEDRHDVEYPHIYFIIIDGVKFFCITKEVHNG